MRRTTETYVRIAEAAQAWASDRGVPGHLHRLAQVVADEAAAFGRGIYPDDATVTTFSRMGCYLCQRLTPAECLPCCGAATNCLLGLPASVRPSWAAQPGAGRSIESVGDDPRIVA